MAEEVQSTSYRVDRSKESLRRVLEVVALALMISCIVFIITMFVLNFDRGVGLTDEALYLLLARYPEAVAYSVSGFGYFTGALLELAGASLFWFRLFGVAILLFCAAVFAAGLEAYLARQTTFELRFVLRFGTILTFSLTYYFAWIVTPSYNWLTLVSLLLASGSALYAAASTDRASAVAWLLLVGVGGAVSFISKPPAGVVLAVGYAGLVAFTALRRTPYLAVFVPAAASMVVLVGFIMVDGGLAATVTKAANGLELVATLGGGHDTSLIAFLMPNWTVVSFLGLMFGLVGGFAIVARLGVHLSPEIIHNAASILLVAAALALASLGLFNGGEMGYRRFTVPVILMVTGGWLAASASRLLCTEPGDPGRFRRYLVASGFCLVIMIAFAIGSAVPLVTNMAGILVLPVALLLHGAYFIDRSTTGMFLATSVSVMCLLATHLLYTALQDPFVVTRPMGEQTKAVEVFGRPHKVDPMLATTISDLRRYANAAGWQPGTPLINLTGNSPLTTVLLDGRFVSGSWLLGGFPGSAEFARRALSFADPTLVREAWLVVTPDGERPISPEVLEHFGMHFPEDYERIGEALMQFKAVPVQGIEQWTETQVLWKPKPVVDRAD